MRLLITIILSVSCSLAGKEAEKKVNQMAVYKNVNGVKLYGIVCFKSTKDSRAYLNKVKAELKDVYNQAKEDYKKNTEELKAWKKKNPGKKYKGPKYYVPQRPSFSIITKVYSPKKLFTLEVEVDKKNAKLDKANEKLVVKFNNPKIMNGIDKYFHISDASNDEGGTIEVIDGETGITEGEELKPGPTPDHLKIPVKEMAMWLSKQKSRVGGSLATKVSASKHGMRCVLYVTLSDQYMKQKYDLKKQIVDGIVRFWELRCHNNEVTFKKYAHVVLIGRGTVVGGKTDSSKKYWLKR